MPDESSRGLEVPSNEDLLRGILHPDWWDPEGEHISSAVFGFPEFSAFIESMTTVEALLQDFDPGSGLVRFNCGEARTLGFDARHEPEDGNNAHANVYCDLNNSQRKKRARKLVEKAVVAVKPNVEQLRGSHGS